MLQTIRRGGPEQVQNSGDTETDDSCSTKTSSGTWPGRVPDESGTGPVRSRAEPGRVRYGARQRSGRSLDESEAAKMGQLHVFRT